MITDLKRTIDQVSRDKGIDRQVLIGTLEEAIRSAARKKFGNRFDLEISFNDDMGEVEVFQFKEVVEKVENEDVEISFEEAKKLDSECELGDSLGLKMDMAEFGRIAAQSAKQVIIQRMKDAEREIVYEDFKDRRGEVINGIIQRHDRVGVIVNLGRTEAFLPYHEMVPKETYRPGDRIRAYVLGVDKEGRGPQIVLSRSHPEFLKALFQIEVPEVSEGLVKIVSVAREPGSRSKIAVVTDDKDIDPVGACVGMKGSRVQAVVQELRGEKIDIVPWSPDPARFIVNALAPAEIVRVVIDEANRTMEVVVPDDQLSLAIGKRGQNVRLAAKLTGWRIDVTSETRYNKVLRDGYESLLSLEGVGDVTAEALCGAGFGSAEELAKATVEELSQISGISGIKAEKLIRSAKALLAQGVEQTGEGHDDKEIYEKD
jgi:transcription termination/antitermination protein NusA